MPASTPDVARRISMRSVREISAGECSFVQRLCSKSVRSSAEDLGRSSPNGGSEKDTCDCEVAQSGPSKGVGDGVK